MSEPSSGHTRSTRSGSNGRPSRSILASVNYPRVTYVVNLDKKGGVKYPVPPPLVTDLPCPKCGAQLNLRRGKRGPWLGCSKFPKCRGRLAWASVPEDQQKALEKALAGHEKQHPVPQLKRRDGSVIPEGTPVASLLLSGGVATLEIHPEARRALEKEQRASARSEPPSTAPA